MGQLNLAARVGAVTTSTARVLVVSLSSGDITLNGVTQTPSAVGSDRGSNDPSGSQIAGYATTFILTGLASNSVYSYTATQGGSSVSGSYRTLPEAGANFSMIFGSCDRIGSFADATGMYGYIKDYAQNGAYPLAGYGIIGDTCYADTGRIDDTGFTGKVATGEPLSTKLAYDKALAYFAQMGLMGSPIDTNSDDNDTNTQNGWSNERQWVFQHVPGFLQWGDHEFNNNFGWDIDPQVDTDQWDTSIEVWDALYGSLQPTAGTDHTEAQNYGQVAGDLYIHLCDSITKGDGGGDSGTVCLGATQIADVKTAFGTDNAPFKLLLLDNSIRYFEDPLSAATGTNTYAANIPLADDRSAEYASLMTDADGIQALAASVGFNFATINGDLHNPVVAQHENTGGTVNESFIQCGVGTINGSGNHNTDASVSIGTTYRGSTLLYEDADRSISTFDYSCVRVDVLGAESQKKMRISLIDRFWNTVWSGEWQEGQSGNLPANSFTMKSAG